MTTMTAPAAAVNADTPTYGARKPFDAWDQAAYIRATYDVAEKSHEQHMADLLAEAGIVIDLDAPKPAPAPEKPAPVPPPAPKPERKPFGWGIDERPEPPKEAVSWAGWCCLQRNIRAGLVSRADLDAAAEILANESEWRRKPAPWVRSA